MSGNLAHWALAEFLEEIPDPRIDRGKKFSLLEVLITALCCVLCGSETWDDIADDAELMQDWFRQELGLRLAHGTPSHDTYRRVFSLLDPAQFQKVFQEWVSSINEILGGQVVAIDGKTLRRAIQNGEEKSSIHVISAWASENGLVLGQMKSEGKANEIKTIPKLLELLKIRGCIVSTDAMGCQTQIAEKILEKGADYLLAVKGNQESLGQDIEGIFEKIDAGFYNRRTLKRFETEEDAHGRIEKRSYVRLSKAQARKIRHLDLGNRWPRLGSITRVVSTRQEKHSHESSRSTRYYISSLTGDTERLASAIRAHWGVENDVHWVLDVEFREDESRMRKEHSPVNFAMIRRLALNLLRADDLPRSLRRKRKRCFRRLDYLLKVLTNQPVGSF